VATARSEIVVVGVVDGEADKLPAAFVGVVTRMAARIRGKRHDNDDGARQERWTIVDRVCVGKWCVLMIS
jgi:hypothetical protein